MLTYGEISCQRCGITWYGPKCGVKYCEECRKVVARERNKKAREKYHIEKEKANKQTRLNAVREITKLADAEGLSYGHYCLKHGI